MRFRKTHKYLEERHFDGYASHSVGGKVSSFNDNNAKKRDIVLYYDKYDKKKICKLRVDKIIGENMHMTVIKVYRSRPTPR